MIYKDAGYGITEKSLAFFRKHREQIGEVLNVKMLKYYIDSRRGWQQHTMRIRGTEGEIWLSGCNAGYGGEGPHGSVTVLRELGYGEEYARLPFHCDNFELDAPKKGKENDITRPTLMQD